MWDVYSIFKDGGKVEKKMYSRKKRRIKKVFLSLSTDTPFRLKGRNINTFLLKNNHPSGH